MNNADLPVRAPRSATELFWCFTWISLQGFGGALFTYFAARWMHRNRQLTSVKAFSAGMAPVVVALVIYSGWVLVAGHRDISRNWPLWLLTGTTILFVLHSKLGILWLLAAGQ